MPLNVVDDINRLFLRTILLNDGPELENSVQLLRKRVQRDHDPHKLLVCREDDKTFNRHKAIRESLEYEIVQLKERLVEKEKIIASQAATIALLKARSGVTRTPRPVQMDGSVQARARSRLTAGDIPKIREMAQTHSQKDIAVIFGVSRSTISNIICGRDWAWVK